VRLSRVGRGVLLDFGADATVADGTSVPGYGVALLDSKGRGAKR
jgi:hypothetical protein